MLFVLVSNHKQLSNPKYELFVLNCYTDIVKDLENNSWMCDNSAIQKQMITDLV